MQAILLISNHGREDNKPPPEKVVSKVYFRNWLLQRQAGSKERRGSLFSDIRKNTRKIKKEKKSNNATKKYSVKGKVVKVPKPNVCKP